MSGDRLRIALVYDCLYPHTVGGAERRYSGLAVRLARRHDVTYVTRRQWRHGEAPAAPPGVRVVAVSRGGELYTKSGRRSITSPLRFGTGVLFHLLRHRRDYDVVHVCSFPFFSLLAARLACAAGGPPVVAEWLEVWSREYWVAYLGPLGGRLGAAVQRRCARAGGPAFVLSRLHAKRLREEGAPRPPFVVSGVYDGPSEPCAADSGREPLVVYAGRHIAEKGVAALPAAIEIARRRVPGLGAVLFGDGPERARVLAARDRLGLRDAIGCPGFVSSAEVDAALRRALCLVLPSRREGYGLVVVEAAALGTPSVVVRAPDSAAAELIEPGENGYVAEDASPEQLADAIVRVHERRADLVRRTHAWFARNAGRLTLDAAAEQVERVYEDLCRGAGSAANLERAEVPGVPGSEEA